MSNINQALNEAQALASLSVLDENPFIVRYYSAWIEDDRLYLVVIFLIFIGLLIVKIDGTLSK
jgi:hypothetical protein